MMTNQKPHSVYLQTPLGLARIKGDELGVSSISVLDHQSAVENNIGKVPKCLEEALLQLTEYFEGKRKTFDINLNLEGTDFQKTVWNALLEIPYGKTFTYMDIAKRLGDPKCIRAAASANGKNPLWIVIPCHRVIGSDGSLTGYAGGLWRKKWLLEHENPVKQQSLF